ncbi:MAG: retron system putative HNH endonuclease [Bryobacteraceae bacterium]
MRAIRKGVEPKSLVEHRVTPGADYEGYRDKDVLRASLVREQRGICCYCLSRIRAEWAAMKIEHWHSQANYPAEQLDYSNLLAACLGGKGSRREGQHCDTRKGDRDLSRNPANPMHRIEEFIRFPGGGRVESTDPAFETEINEVLNLNQAYLVKQRKRVLDGFTEALRKWDGPLPRGVLEKHVREWNGELGSGELKPFCQVVVYYLRKRLARPRAR